MPAGYTSEKHFPTVNRRSTESILPFPGVLSSPVDFPGVLLQVRPLHCGDFRRRCRREPLRNDFLQQQHPQNGQVPMPSQSQANCRRTAASHRGLQRRVGPGGCRGGA